MSNDATPAPDAQPPTPSPATRAEWREDSRPTNHDSAREAVLNRRIIQLLDALDAAERREEPDAIDAEFDGFLIHIETDPLCSQYREPTTPAQRVRFDAARGIVCPACAAADTSDKAWADGYNHAKVETLTLPTGDPAGVVADEAYRAGYEDGLRDARRGSRSSGGRRRRDALTGNWITPRPTHKPFTDDGVTYCGWATDRGVIDGCGEVWPCSTVRARTECVTCSGRGVWMDEPCPDCAPFYCYPCARGDHDEHKLAWVPDIPCECPECVPPLGGDS